ncbi:SemiSWEET transporter [Marinobacterium sedimentorum]|uniref:SemiSWEET transporter n=1 Tax=Marinobacterium sedimentorum TaxID=2927804 RepID=UPI0020C5F848|nr:SemiSWEET transporter [Marinobacterium sedimentorum]MCP8687463.1 SemiSWEET transporter [Marinobacterium sedimentorum]
MDNTTLIGMVAALCTTAAFVPQVLRILKTGNVEGISVSMYSILTFGVALWLIYGIILQDLPMFLANLVTFLLSSSVLALTLRKRFQKRRELSDAVPHI